MYGGFDPGTARIALLMSTYKIGICRIPKYLSAIHAQEFGNMEGHFKNHFGNHKMHHDRAGGHFDFGQDINFEDIFDSPFMHQQVNNSSIITYIRTFNVHVIKSETSL